MNKYAPKNINKEEAQKLYDSGLSIRKLALHYSVCQATISRLGLDCRTVSDAIKNSYSRGERYVSEERKVKLSESAKEKGLGGYRPHPNKGKYYKDIWFDSKWEVLVAKSLDENGISWIRPSVGFVWNDAGRKYYPDFYLPDFDIYLDPKNPFLQKKDKEKIDNVIERHGIKVLILSESELSWEVIRALIV